MPIKKAPERWQSLSKKQLVGIDLVVCLDYVMFLTVLEGVFIPHCSLVDGSQLAKVL